MAERAATTPPFHCLLSFAFLECQIPLSPPFLKGDLEGFLYELKNVVAQFIGQLCLMNQATTKSCGEAACNDNLVAISLHLMK
jgi:hypothetical protein